MARSGLLELDNNLKYNGNASKPAMVIPAMGTYIQNFTREQIFVVDGWGKYVINPTMFYQSHDAVYSTDSNVVLLSRAYTNPNHLNDQTNITREGNMIRYNMIPQAPFYMIGHKCEQPPKAGKPLIIPDFNMVAFYSEEEMNRAVATFGSEEKLVDYYVRVITGSYNGAYRSMARSGEEPIYFTTENSIYEIPRMPPDVLDEYIERFSIDRERLKKEDIIFIMTVVDHRDGTPSHVSTSFEFVNKNLKYPGEPIVYTNGLILFTSKESARSYVDKYKGQHLEYFVDLAIETGREFYEGEIDRIKKRSKTRSIRVLEIISYMGLSSILTAGSQVAIEKITDYSSAAKDMKTAASELKSGFSCVKQIADLVKAISGR